MEAALLLAIPAALAGCGQEQAVPGQNVGATVRHSQGGRLLDLAGVLSPAESREIARRLDQEQQADGRAVIVVLVRPAQDTSLEYLAWAVGGRQVAAPHMLFVDPDALQVRIEGDLSPESKAVVVRAMQPALRGRRYGEAISAGLIALERLAP